MLRDEDRGAGVDLSVVLIGYDQNPIVVGRAST